MQTENCSNPGSLILGAQILHIKEFEGNLHFLALNTFLLIPIPFLLLHNLVILPSLKFTTFAPPPPPWHFYCFTSTTTTITYLLFSLQHHHQPFFVSLPPPPQFYCFPPSTTTTITFLLFPSSTTINPFLIQFNFHQHQHHISIALPTPPPPPPPSNRLLKENVKQAKGRKGITGHLYNLSIWRWWWENNKHLSYFIFTDLKITKQPVQPVRPPKKST